MSVIPDGERWRCQFYYKDWYGEKHRKNKRGLKSEKEAKAWEKEFVKRYNMKYILFKDFVKLYLEDQVGRIRDTTMEGKNNIINTKILPFFGEKELHSIKPLEIRKWQNELLKKNYSQTYVRTINNQLAVLFHFAEKFYDLDSNPCRKAGTIGLAKAEEMNYWEKEEFDRFLELVKDKPTSYLIFEILFWTGMRIGELLALTENDIDLDKRTININKCLVRLKGENVIHTPKTARGKRTISVPTFLANDIEVYLSKLYGIMMNEQIFKVTNPDFHAVTAHGAVRVRMAAMVVVFCMTREREWSQHPQMILPFSR